MFKNTPDKKAPPLTRKTGVNILVAGKKNLMHWPENVAAALNKRSDCYAEVFLYNKRTLSNALMHLVPRHWRFLWLAKQFERRIRQLNPDLILIPQAFFIPQELYDVLGKFPTVCRIGWQGDFFGTCEISKARYLDYLLCSDTGYLKNTKTFPCKSVYMPLCVNEETFINQDLPRTEPPFFAGVANKKRTDFLAACQTKCVIYGKGWNLKRLKQHDVHNTKIPHTVVRGFLARTQAAINMSWSPNIVNGLNFRVFENAATGALIVLNEQKDLALCYDIGREAVTYKTPADLDALLRDIIKRPRHYEKIARAGYERTLKEHTFYHRMGEILHLALTGQEPARNAKIKGRNNNNRLHLKQKCSK